MDWHALAFAIVLSVGTALLFGVVPAFRLMHADHQESLRAVGRSLTEARSKLRIREWLVAIEVGLSAVLLIVAGLLMTSFIRLGEVDRGFNAQNVLTAEISLPNTRYPDKEKRRQFYRDLTSRIEARSGVIAAGVISVLPLQGDAWADIVTIEGDTRRLAERPILRYRTVSPNYLRAMGIPLSAGRSIQETDYPRRVAVVSKGAAEKIWRGENPIGKRFRRSVPTEPAFEVLGVAGDVRSTGLDKEPEPIVYVSLWERAPETGSIAIRTNSDPRQAIGFLRESVKSLDPDVPIAQLQTMTQIESDSVAQRRFQTLLVLSFAASALLLAALGTYSILAYSVSCRTNEIGIRMALGAKPVDVLTMVLRQGLWPVAVGLGAGIVGALAIGRFLAALLFSVSAKDPATFVVVAGITLAAALVACWIPARRAARLAPLEALRYE
jgi:putative ABC transport system permease protein